MSVYLLISIIVVIISILGYLLNKVEIAYLLKDISRQRQVFCVTHQPLVAAVADHHFSISKTSLDGETSSKVFELKGFEERKHELAQLAGGDFVEASIYAASLLEKKAA